MLVTKKSLCKVDDLGYNPDSLARKQFSTSTGLLKRKLEGPT